MFETVPWWMWIVGFLLVLGPLVTLHELGHYLVARWFGVCLLYTSPSPRDS